MRLVSARESRENQTKVLSASLMGESIVLTSRVGSFRLVPISDDDDIVRKDLQAAATEVKSHILGVKDLPLAKDIMF